MCLFKKGNSGGKNFKVGQIDQGIKYRAYLFRLSFTCIIREPIAILVTRFRGLMVLLLCHFDIPNVILANQMGVPKLTRHSFLSTWSPGRPPLPALMALFIIFHSCASVPAFSNIHCFLFFCFHVIPKISMTFISDALPCLSSSSFNVNPSCPRVVARLPHHCMNSCKHKYRQWTLTESFFRTNIPETFDTIDLAWIDLTFVGEFFIPVAKTVRLGR